jgi:hypothetical protein
MALPFMAHRPRDLLLVLVLAAPLATGCMVGTRSRGRPAHASEGWRGSPPPQRVPPGQIRRAEVHERNEARKGHGNKHEDHGHGHGHD